MPRIKNRPAGMALILGAALLFAGYAAQSTAACQGPSIPYGAPCYDLAFGEMVFTRACLSCHARGVHGAPRLGDALDWEDRLRQDPDTLTRHAIVGHGRMPPKGGFFMLSDREVAAAVAYVIERSRKIILAREKKPVEPECHPIDHPENCSRKDLEDVMTLHMLWLLGNPGK